MRLRVVTANVRAGMSRAQARSALDIVLGEGPDVVALQEWYAVRRDLLPRGEWAWRAPLLGGCAIGVRRDVLAVVGRRTHWLSRPGRADRGEARWGWEPGRAATVVRCRHRETNLQLGIVDYHLVAGVQARDAYRADRPLLVARHQKEKARLTRLCQRLSDDGDEVVAAGDSNEHGFVLPGLASTWTEDTTAGTLGPRRRVDNVFSPGTPSLVRLLETGSDHRAVVVDVQLPHA